MKGLKMAARKTITHSQSPHTYTLWQIRQRQNQWDQAPTCTVIAQQVYLNQLLVLQQQQKNTCDVYNNKVPSKQGEILQKVGQILLVEEVHDHPDNNTIGAILVQDFFQLHSRPLPPHYSCTRYITRKTKSHSYTRKTMLTLPRMAKKLHVNRGK